MNEATAELLRRGVLALRRSALWWGGGIVALCAMTLAFWPSIEGTDALDEIMRSQPDLMEAFGIQTLSTAAGYLDGQLYALMLPILFSGLAIAGTSGLTSGDEDAGRLELLHALPIARRVIWLSRAAAAYVVVAAVSVMTAIVVVASLGPFSLDGVGVGRILVATLGCGALAVFHGAVAYAVGGAGGSRAMSAGVGIAVMVAGYVLNYLVPLADALKGLRKASPWYWAIGDQPVTNGLPGAWMVVLVVAVAALLLAGTAAIERRDIRSA